MIDSVGESLTSDADKQQNLYSKQRRCEAEMLGCIPNCKRQLTLTLQLTAYITTLASFLTLASTLDGTLNAIPACFASWW